MKTIAVAAILALAPISVALADDVAFTAKVDGKDWTADREFWTETSLAGKPAINITAFAEAGDPKSRIGFNLVLPTAGSYVGTYTLGKLDATGNYVSDESDPGNLEDLYTFKQGTLTVTAYDAATKTLTGTFSGSVRNALGTGSFDIAGGSFSGVGFSQ
jgi:hypothetical protein